MMKQLAALTTYFIPSEQQIDKQDYHRYRIFVNTCFLVSFFALCYILQDYIINFQEGIYLMIYMFVIGILLPFLFKKNVNFHVLLNILLFSIIGSFVMEFFWSGGIVYSPLRPFAFLAAAIALLMSEIKIAIFWLIMAILIFIIFSVFQVTNYPVSSIFPASFDVFFRLTSYIGFLLIMYFIIYIFEKDRMSAMEELTLEKENSENLLLNILPYETAQELKEKGHADAHLYENTSVLFTDFKNFTLMSERVSPQELVSELHACFRVFDEIIEKYDIEKIKTVGDGYVAASGLPTANNNHAENIVKAALEIRDFMVLRKLDKEEKTFEIRIGINSGPLVAGIVGVKKFAYDIWGDTVNTAARMEQFGEEGKVNISESTYELVKNKFDCWQRGKIEAKNKGSINMYFVENKQDTQK